MYAAPRVMYLLVNNFAVCQFLICLDHAISCIRRNISGSDL